MSEQIQSFKSVHELQQVTQTLREQHIDLPELTTQDAIDVLSEWGHRIAHSDVMHSPGMVFLTLWLRRGSLLALAERELGQEYGGWQTHRSSFTRRLPLGVIGHFPAANVPIQPLLSAACGALGGNSGIIRVPTGLEKITADAARLLHEADPQGRLAERMQFVSIPTVRRDLMEVMANACDGAMIWGGKESVLSVRSLPFPHWTRICTFGPRLSIAMVDAEAWTHRQRRVQLCQRLARDVWQFEQQACTSPQVLYLERSCETSIEPLLDSLEQAFAAENQLHPRLELNAHAAASIVRARAEWVSQNDMRTARYPLSPDWTILAGEGVVTHDPVQFRCLFVSEVDDLGLPLQSLDGNVQTLGIDCRDPETERVVVRDAVWRGVDRVCPLGRMHVFDSPWDGKQLVAPMTRQVRYTRASDSGSSSAEVA